MPKKSKNLLSSDDSSDESNPANIKKNQKVVSSSSENDSDLDQHQTTKASTTANKSTNNGSNTTGSRHRPSKSDSLQTGNSTSDQLQQQFQISDVGTDEAISDSSSEVSEEEEGKFPDGYDADCVGDGEDKAKLNKMSEIDREAELYSRIEAREKLQTKKRYQRKLKIERKQKRRLKRELQRKKKQQKALREKTQNDSDDSDTELRVPNKNKRAAAGAVEDSSDSDAPRSKRHKPSNSSDSDDSNYNMKLKKAKTKSKKPKSRSSSSEKDEDSSDADDESYDEHLTGEQKAKKQRNRQLKKLTKMRKEKNKKMEKNKALLKASEVYSDASSTSADTDDERKKNDFMSDSDDGECSDSDEDLDDRAINCVDELSLVKLSRFRCEQWCHMPFFEETVKGMFIRIGLGKSTDGKDTYRCAKVLNVLKCPKVYQLGPTRTNQALNVQIGIGKKGFRLNFISNQPFTESEFNFYKEQMEKNNCELPCLKELKKKAKDIEKLKKEAEDNMSQKDFEKMVENKKKFRYRPTSFARKKSALIKERQKAETDKNMLLMTKLDKELEALDESAKKIEIVRIGNQCNANTINEKIRSTFNNKQKQKAVIESNREYRYSTQVNPFMRRKTTPMMGNYDKVQKGLEGKYRTDIDRRYETDYTHVNKNKNKKEEEPVTVTKKDKKNNLVDAHNFELDIDIPMTIG